MIKKVILCVLLILLPSSLSAITLSELEQAVRDELAPHISDYFPDSLVIRKINDACKDIANQSYVICKLDTVITVIDQMLYDLNTDIIYVNGIEAVYPLRMGDRRALIWISPSLSYKEPYDFTGSKSIAYWYHGAKLALIPVPAVIDTLVVLYYAQANELTADTSTTLLPADLHNLIVFYATGMLLARRNPEKASWYLNLYNAWLEQKILRRVNKSYDIRIQPSISEGGQ